jgi:hypothetical protein
MWVPKKPYTSLWTPQAWQQSPALVHGIAANAPVQTLQTLALNQRGVCLTSAFPSTPPPPTPSAALQLPKHTMWAPKRPYTSLWIPPAWQHSLVLVHGTAANAPVQILRGAMQAATLCG